MNTIKNKAIIVAGFPGVGKTTVCLENDSKGCSKCMSDSDSSSFSWTYDNEGNKVRNPEFPENYIQHIRNIYSTHDYIFTSTHEEVRNLLIKEFEADNLVVVYPSKEIKKEWIQRLRDRGSNEKFCELVETNYDAWVDDVETFVVESGVLSVCISDPTKGMREALNFIDTLMTPTNVPD